MGFQDLWVKMEVFRGNKGRVRRYWPPNELVLSFGGLHVCVNLVKIDEEMRPWVCPQTDRHTHALLQIDWIFRADENEYQHDSYVLPVPTETDDVIKSEVVLLNVFRVPVFQISPTYPPIVLSYLPQYSSFSFDPHHSHDSPYAHALPKPINTRAAKAWSFCFFCQLVVVKTQASFIHSS